jgi:hypothetical protein
LTAAAVIRAGLALAVRPALWGTAARQLMVLAAPGWWRRWPPRPWPDEDYLRFRLLTAYGDPEQPPAATDVVAWLRWCKQMRALRAKN